MTPTPLLRMIPEVLEGFPSEKNLRILLRDEPIPPNSRAKYGTAGFRYKVDSICDIADERIPPLDSIMVRVGITATLRSRVKQEAMGVMVTASHNDETYNGVKIVDPDGGMMDVTGEELALEVVNECDAEKVVEWSLLEGETSTSPSASFYTPVIHIGHDLRSHSSRLAQCVMAAASALGATVYHHGIVTTPQLHHIVLHSNPRHIPIMIPSRPSLKGYFELIVNAYVSLVEGAAPLVEATPSTLLVDCACGVGFPHANLLKETLDDVTSGYYPPVILVPTNKPLSGPLNESCGSEHVQKTRMPPKWYDSCEHTLASSKPYCASLDGDSDRIVFFAENLGTSPDTGGGGNLILLDGDKIACLISQFIIDELYALNQELKLIHAEHKLTPLSVGVVQTAYANGASTAFLRRVLGSERVKFAKTGVKYVHAAAHEFDIGIYFEANGHGTVLFGPEFYTYLAQASAILQKGRKSENYAVPPKLASSSPRNHVGWLAVERLRALPLLINQAVGDALSDLFLVDAILRIKGWDLMKWDAMYNEFPSRQGKVRIKNRHIIQTNESETRCLEPSVVQDELDRLIQEVGGGSAAARVFIRPSGTEDVVRIYAEAETPKAADQLANGAAQIVYKHCGGVGDLSLPASKM